MIVYSFTQFNMTTNKYSEREIIVIMDSHMASNTSDPIDLPGFDSAGYYDELLSKSSLDQLLSLQSLWHADIARLEEESKQLIQAHHKEYLRAAQLMQKLIQLPDYIKDTKGRLEKCYADALNAQQKVYNTTTLDQKGNVDIRIELLTLYNQELQYIDFPFLETPKRMRALLKEERYGEAIQEYVDFFEWITTSQELDTTLFESIKEECKNLLKEVTDCILTEFRTIPKSIEHSCSDVKTLLALGVHHNVLVDIFTDKLTHQWILFKQSASTILDSDGNDLLDWLEMPSRPLYQFLHGTYRPYYDAFMRLFVLDGQDDNTCASTGLRDQARDLLLMHATQIDNELIHMILTHSSLDIWVLESQVYKKEIHRLLDNVHLLIEYALDNTSDTLLPFLQKGIYILEGEIIQRFSFSKQAQVVANRNIDAWTNDSVDLDVPCFWTKSIQKWSDRGVKMSCELDQVIQLDAEIQTRLLKTTRPEIPESIKPSVWFEFINSFEKRFLPMDKTTTRDYRHLEFLFFVPRYIFLKRPNCPKGLLMLSNRFMSVFAEDYCSWVVTKSESEHSKNSESRSFLANIKDFVSCYTEIYSIACKSSTNKGITILDSGHTSSKDNFPSIQAHLAALLLQDTVDSDVKDNLHINMFYEEPFISHLLEKIIKKAHMLSQDELEILLYMNHA